MSDFTKTGWASTQGFVALARFIPLALTKKGKL